MGRTSYRSQAKRGLSCRLCGEVTHYVAEFPRGNGTANATPICKHGCRKDRKEGRR